MKLDKRIKDRTGIQTCISFDKKYIGKKGFFFDEFCQLIDLKAKCCYGTLIDINETDLANDLCFKATSDKTGYNCFFRFFIPEDSLLPEVKPEKKYRPFTPDEFADTFTIGEPIIFRRKQSKRLYEYNVLFIGCCFLGDNTDVVLGNDRFSLETLFNNYEWRQHGSYEWKPFGIEVKENEEE